MYRLRRPDPEGIDRFLAAQGRLACSHGAEGIAERAAAGEATELEGFRVGRAAAELGRGAEAYGRAMDALRSWRVFPAPIEVWRPDAPIAVGTVVAVLGRPLGIWSLNALRILEVTEEEDERGARFGFRYGTLPDHAVVGEERFRVQWNRDDDRVHYALVSCARQGKLAARIAAPLSRRLQERFRAASARSIAHYVDGSP